MKGSDARDSLAKTETPVQVAKISLMGDIDGPQALAFATALAAVHDASAAAVVIEIDSPGGSVSDGLIIAKLIEQSAVPTVCIVDGDAASMAFFILQSCSVRAMTKRSSLMAHLPWIRGGMGGETEYKNIAEALRVKGHALCQHMARRMKLTPAQLEARLQRGDWWMTFEEASAVGAVDKVWDSVAEAVASMRLGHRP